MDQRTPIANLSPVQKWKSDVTREQDWQVTVFPWEEKQTFENVSVEVAKDRAGALVRTLFAKVPPRVPLA
jgi:hypothetical protein